MFGFGCWWVWLVVVVLWFDFVCLIWMCCFVGDLLLLVWFCLSGWVCVSLVCVCGFVCITVVVVGFVVGGFRLCAVVFVVVLFFEFAWN